MPVVGLMHVYGHKKKEEAKTVSLGDPFGKMVPFLVKKRQQSSSGKIRVHCSPFAGGGGDFAIRELFWYLF